MPVFENENENKIKKQNNLKQFICFLYLCYRFKFSFVRFIVLSNLEPQKIHKICLNFNQNTIS